MSLLLWLPQLQVNIDEIDQQHRQLFEFANTFYNKLYKGQNETGLQESLTNLIQFSATHFKYEEDLRESNNDPKKEWHTREHTDFINQMNRINTTLQAGELRISVELIEYLRSAIINHIFTTDKDMANFIIQKTQ